MVGPKPYGIDFLFDIVRSLISMEKMQFSTMNYIDTCKLQALLHLPVYIANYIP